MTNGGETGQTKSRQTIKLAGLIVPLLLTFYSIFVQLGIIEGSSYASTYSFYAIIVSSLILAAVQFLLPVKGYRDAYIRLIGYHVITIAYVVFISGIYTPIASLWIVLTLASYVYCGVAGLKLNLISIFAILLADPILTQSFNQTKFAADLLLLLVLACTGLIVIIIVKYHEIDQLAFLKSQQQEKIQRDRILTIVNNLADAILSTDEHGVISIYNAATLNLLDTNGNLEGKHIDEIVRLHDQSGKTIKLMSVLSKSKSVTVRDDVILDFLDGESIRLELTYSPIRSSFSVTKKSQSQIGYIIIMRDITKAKSLEEERDEFISVVSHELRTPITIAEGAISNAQLLLDRGNANKDTVNSTMGTAHEQVLFLARMVNDLSTLSRAERGVADTPEEISVKELVYKIYNNYTAQAEDKGLQFNLDTHGKLGKITASRLYLEELIQNFITNAIKYTMEGTIVFDVRQSDGKVTFTVKDSGIGISKSDQHKIFDKFFRSEDYRTRETGGTGLGLYVAAKLSKKLGTRIELTSRINHGSSFSFSLPVEK